MSDTNKTSYNEILSVVDAIHTNEHSVEWHGVTLNIKNTLTFAEMLAFSNEVVSTCFIDKTAEYVPEVKDFAVRCAILEYYGNIELPDDASERYQMVYCSDIVQEVTKYVNGEQLEPLLKSIDKKIAHVAQNNIEAFNKQMSEAVSKLTEVEDSLSSIFGGIDQDTITGLASTIANGNFDIEKLVDVAAKAVEKDNTEHNKVVNMPKKENSDG